MYFFRIIIPTNDQSQNSQELLNDSVNSITSQTIDKFNYIIVVPHDGGYQGEGVRILDDRTFHVYHKSVEMKGGNINRAIDGTYGMDFTGEYTLFLDEGDVLASNTVLEELRDFIVKNEKPDLIRLPYKKVYNPGDNGIIKRYGGEKTLADIASSSKVAPWTKCVKSSLLARFPYHMVHEDVVQHIAQIDKIKTFAKFPSPVVESRLYKDDPDIYPPITEKTSILRLVAELMDLNLTHDYCEEVRENRIDFYANMIGDDYDKDNEIFSKLARELSYKP